jgi:hypothetical protein
MIRPTLHAEDVTIKLSIDNIKDVVTVDTQKPKQENVSNKIKVSHWMGTKS